MRLSTNDLTYMVTDQELSSAVIWNLFDRVSRRHGNFEVANRLFRLRVLRGVAALVAAMLLAAVGFIVWGRWWFSLRAAK